MILITNSGSDGLVFSRRKVGLKGLVGERGFEPPTPWSRTGFFGLWAWYERAMGWKGCGISSLRIAASAQPKPRVPAALNFDYALKTYLRLDCRRLSCGVVVRHLQQ